MGTTQHNPSIPFIEKEEEGREKKDDKYEETCL